MSTAPDLRKRMPPVRHGLTGKLICGNHEIYLTVNFYEDDGVSPGEVFVTTAAKHGSDLAGWVDAWAVSVSIMLQYGVPWEKIRDKFAHTKFGEAAATEDKSILHVVVTGIDSLIQKQKSLQG